MEEKKETWNTVKKITGCEEKQLGPDRQIHQCVIHEYEYEYE